MKTTFSENIFIFLVIGDCAVMEDVGKRGTEGSTWKRLQREWYESELNYIYSNKYVPLINLSLFGNAILFTSYLLYMIHIYAAKPHGPCNTFIVFD